jgi:hypothetical protein
MEITLISSYNKKAKSIERSIVRRLTKTIQAKGEVKKQTSYGTLYSIQRKAENGESRLQHKRGRLTTLYETTRLKMESLAPI